MTLHVNTSSRSLLLSSVKRIQAQTCETLRLHKVSLYSILNYCLWARNHLTLSVCFVVLDLADHPIRSQALTNSLACVLIAM